MYIYGHMCDKYDLKIKLRIKNADLDDLVQTTSIFTDNMDRCEDYGASYQECEFTIT